MSSLSSSSTSAAVLKHSTSGYSSSMSASSQSVRDSRTSISDRQDDENDTDKPRMLAVADKVASGRIVAASKVAPSAVNGSGMAAAQTSSSRFMGRNVQTGAGTFSASVVSKTSVKTDASEQNNTGSNNSLSCKPE